MKLLFAYKINRVRKVALRRRAWIETRERIITVRKVGKVALRRRAWIETA